MVVCLLSLMSYPHSLLAMDSKFWDPMRGIVGTKTEVVTREQGIAVTVLTMLLLGEMWIWGLWIRKAVV